MTKKPVLTVLAGPNGAGKTRLTPYLIEQEFISVEPIDSDKVAQHIDETRFSNDFLRYESQRLKDINRIFRKEAEKAIKQNNDFAYESNLSTSYQLQPVGWFDENGYELNLIFILLDNLELSKNRVEKRKTEKGHSVSKEDIIQNFKNGLTNLNDSFNDWDNLLIINNSKTLDKNNSPELLLFARQGEIVYCSDTSFSSEITEFIPDILKKAQKHKPQSSN